MVGVVDKESGAEEVLTRRVKWSVLLTKKTVPRECLHGEMVGVVDKEGGA